MDESRKRETPEVICTAYSSNKRRCTPPSEHDVIPTDDYDVEEALLSVDEEAFADLWELLEENTTPVKVSFVTCMSPAPAIFQPSAAYVTINGNEESCGSSFSDGESSVMASFDFAGVTALYGGAWGTEEDEGKGSDGCDCLDEYEEMMVRLLGEDTSEYS